MPELGCLNMCAKVCTAVDPNTVSTSAKPPPACLACYDCEVPDMLYAFWCTILAFMICNTYHKCCSGGKGFFNSQSYTEKFWTEKIQMPEMPYSQLAQPKRAISRDTCCQACTGMFFLSFFSCLLAFTIVNLLDYLISVHWLQEEMCLKVFDWQNFHIQGHWWINHSIFTCMNGVCFYRLWGLFVTVWMSLWAIFCYWRYYLEVTVEQQEVKRVEAKIEYGGGGGAGAFAYGGSSMIACTVQ